MGSPIPHFRPEERSQIKPVLSEAGEFGMSCVQFEWMNNPNSSSSISDCEVFKHTGD